MRIEVRNLRKRFGPTQVLRGIDLNLAAGKRVALIGPNGSGKSTLLRALLGLVACDGEVLLDGRSPFDHRVELAQRLAYVPQVAPAISATVEELVRTVAETRALDRAAIDGLTTRLELPLDEIGDRPFRNLSGGMKQKLLLALALAARPSLVVLDEPTASLDARARDRFFALCESLPRETTLVLCSHRLEELRSLSDHVVALADGKVAWDGAASEFLARGSKSVIEVQLDAGTDAAWLSAKGFQTGAQGWFTRTVTQEEKRTLVPELTAQLASGLANVLIRDLEAIDVQHG